MNASRTTNKVGTTVAMRANRGWGKKDEKSRWQRRRERAERERRTKEERVDWRRGRARYCRLIRQLRSIGWQGGRPAIT